MSKIKENVWILALIGGILGIIGFVTPAAYMNFLGASFYLWKFGSYYGTGSGQTQMGFITEMLGGGGDYTIVIILIIISIVLSTLGSVGLLLSPAKTRDDYDGQGKLWIIFGIFLIAAEIIFIVGVGTVNIGFGWTFWTIFQVGAGVIFGFIGGAIALVAGLMGEYGDRLS